MKDSGPFINVFVTGNGPFPDGNGGYNEKNTSHLITKLLPSVLWSKSAVNPTDVRIRIANPTAADGAYVKTEYAYIREYMKQMHEQYDESIDVFVHLGMGGGDHVRVERRAYKQGMSSSWWNMRDHDYYMVEDDVGETVEGAGPCPWDGIPIGLATAFDVDAVVEGAENILAVRRRYGEPTAMHAGPLTVKAHHEAGFYCCGFIFYESLANCYRRRRSPDVLFCHVPDETDQASLERAKDTVLAVIVSAANELLKRRAKAESTA